MNSCSPSFQPVPQLHSRVVALLESIASFEGADPAAVLKKLSLGDRAALLLTARKLMIGDTLSCTTSLPKLGRAMSLDISADAIIQADHPEPRIDYGLEASGFSLRVRPLTAEDQDDLITRTSGPDALTQELARACIVRSEPTLPENNNLPESLLEAVSLPLEEIDPLSDIKLHLLCPECRPLFPGFAFGGRIRPWGAWHARGSARARGPLAGISLSLE